MKDYCNMLYSQLQVELFHCLENKTESHQQIETCFQVANRYWNKVKERLKDHQFAGDDEEIEFFKQLKPKFTSEIEYYSLVYHCYLFRPSDPETMVEFWNRECRRLEKFNDENKVFLLCYHNENNELTPYYFLSRYCLDDAVGAGKLYDAGCNVLTNGDSLVASFLALQRYQEFAEQKRMKLPEL